jgi:polyisoprenoid-binding protein YceI
VARFDVVPEQSRVWIDARSNVHPIHSRTEGLQGWIDLDVPDGRLTLAVARLSSGNPLQDRELKRRIEARRHPTIDGVLTGVAPLAGDGRYHAEGDLSFLGVTRHVEGEITVELVDGHTIHLEGRSTFDIRDFGMEPPRIFVLRVEPIVDVRVELLAVSMAR